MRLTGFRGRACSLGVDPVWILYEYVITIGQEVRTVWAAPRWTANSLLLILTRWCMITLAVINHIPAKPEVRFSLLIHGRAYSLRVDRGNAISVHDPVHSTHFE